MQKNSHGDFGQNYFPDFPVLLIWVGVRMGNDRMGDTWFTLPSTRCRTLVGKWGPREWTPAGPHLRTVFIFIYFK